MTDSLQTPDSLPAAANSADGADVWNDSNLDNATALIDAPTSDPAEPAEPVEPSPETQPAGEADSWWELAKTLFYALLIALFVRTFFFQPYNIPSGSMESTLLVGDYLFVEKFSYGYSKYSFPFGRLLPSFGRVFASEPHRGDVIVFALPSDPSIVFIKRLIGLPGDRVQMIGGVLYLNDKPVPKVRVSDFVDDENGYEHHIARYRETLPSGKSYYVLDSIPDGPNDDTPVYTVPAGHYFMMGDNRDDSDDSRGIVGYLPAENLVGKAEFKFFSIDDSKTHWWQFWTWPWAIRYDRLFTFID
ncbi:MAG: signal peptidase I [Alphaproteobacteria bacterium]|nr:signal peptidase I [Alphaproteobacteria bacterium]